MRNDYGPAMNWYRAGIANLNFEDEKSANLDPKLHGPVMMIIAARDALNSGVQEMKALVDDLRVETLRTGHWVQLEIPDEVNRLLGDFMGGVEGREKEK